MAKSLAGLRLNSSIFRPKTCHHKRWVGDGFYEWICAITCVKKNDFQHVVTSDTWKFYFSNLINLREKGYRCWILTGVPFSGPIGGWSAYRIPSLYYTLWLHISITVNAEKLYTYAYVYFSNFVRNVVYGSTLKRH